jgi:hypothetical protein
VQERKDSPAMNSEFTPLCLRRSNLVEQHTGPSGAGKVPVNPLSTKQRQWLTQASTYLQKHPPHTHIPMSFTTPYLPRRAPLGTMTEDEAELTTMSPPESFYPSKQLPYTTLNTVSTGIGYCLAIGSNINLTLFGVSVSPSTSTLHCA